MYGRSPSYNQADACHMYKYNGRSIIVNLTLHGIGNTFRSIEPGEEEVWLSVETLDRFMGIICHRKDVVLTVDDGNSSDTDIILSTLLRHKMKAVFFISAGNIGLPGYVSRNDVQRLVKAGMAIGSHGMCHRNWRSLSDSELSEDLFTSKNILEQITGQSVFQAACPFGSYDRRVLRYLRKVGFERVYTSDPGVAKFGVWLQGRNTLHRSDTIESFKRIIDQPVFSSKGLVQTIKTSIKRLR